MRGLSLGMDDCEKAEPAGLESSWAGLSAASVDAADMLLDDCSGDVSVVEAA